MGGFIKSGEMTNKIIGVRVRACYNGEVIAPHGEESLSQSFLKHQHQLYPATPPFFFLFLQYFVQSAAG